MNPSDDLTIEAALRKGTGFLKSLGIEAARLEMELILAESMGWDRLRLYLNLKNPFPDAARDKSRAMLARRRRREPLAYILGHKEFYGLRFAVTPAVLIPRPETEILVDRAVKWSQAWAAGRGEALMADIGTGSGAIAVAAAHEQQKRNIAARWIATDVSEAALVVARSNAKTHGVEDRIDFRPGAFMEPLGAPVDCICSNPPYIADSDREALAPEIRDWEPKVALFSGPQGLEHLRRMIGSAANCLNPGGAVFLEIGQNQGAHVAAMLQETGAFAPPVFHPDLAGIARVVEARRHKGEVNSAFSQ